jgi:chemotaxis protein CheZ
MMSPPPQKAVFSAEMHLGRMNGHRMNGHSHGTNGTAPKVADSSSLDAVHAELKRLADRIDKLAPAGAVITSVSGEPIPITAGDTAAFDKVRAEVEAIAARITLTKQEIATLKHPLATDDKLTSASMELSAVVKSTEEATQAIMHVAEHLDELAREITSHVTDAFVISRLNEMTESITKLFEACSFQDLTGQRITKVVKTIDFIEERVEMMQVIWGRKDIERIPVPEDQIAKVDDGLVLHGPSDASQGAISQDEVDKLFS